MQRTTLRRLAVLTVTAGAMFPGTALAATHGNSHSLQARKHARATTLHARAATPHVPAALRRLVAAQSAGARGAGSISLGRIVAGGGGLHGTSNGPVVELVKGYSTGDPGSASDETCAGFAGQVNDAWAEATSAFGMDDDDAGVKWGGTAVAIQDYGMDNGCFFIDPLD
jgi:hypothetical protein